MARRISRRSTQSQATTLARTRSRARRDFWLPVLGALGVVAVVIFGVVFLPKLLSRPIDSFENEELYASYKSLYDEAKNFNYAYGGDLKLEKKIKTALDSDTDNLGGYFFYVLAAGEYYYHVRDYDRALKFAKEAETYSATDDQFVENIELFLRIYKKLGDAEAVAKWQSIYEEYQVDEDSECATSDEDEEGTE